MSNPQIEFTTDAKVQMIQAEAFAQMLQLSTRTLWRLLSTGELIEPVRLGRSVRWRLAEVERWIEEGCPAPAEFEQSKNTGR